VKKAGTGELSIVLLAMKRFNPRQFYTIYSLLLEYSYLVDYTSIALAITARLVDWTHSSCCVRIIGAFVGSDIAMLL
jgi:hypothetical protein